MEGMATAPSLPEQINRCEIFPRIG